MKMILVKMKNPVGSDTYNDILGTSVPASDAA